MSINSTVLRAVFGIAALVGATAAQAQHYPSRPIRIVLPYTPAGIVDYVGRTIGQELSEASGQTVIPENKPGASGMIGIHTVTSAAADGYTVLLMDPAIVINPVLQTGVTYDLFKDLKVVSVVSTSPLVLVTAPSLPTKSFQEFIAYAKANPGKLNYASPGVGTLTYLAGKLFCTQTGVEATHVPYRGIAASFPDLITGKVQFSFSSIPGAKTFTDDNRLHALATTGAKRSPAYPDLPTVKEAGLPDFEVDLWLAVFVPAKTPDAVVARLSAALKKALDNPKIKIALARVGVEPRGTTPTEATSFVRAEFEKWKKVVEDAHLKQ
jgi:tripartite-type tricarboxylate transporter receptor subunit TctC